MDLEIMKRGPELEKRMLNLFSKQGWDCTQTYKIRLSDDLCLIPDITLAKDDHIYGFVECFLGSINERHRERIIYLLETYKPELFIITNGLHYEVYFDGKYVGTMTVPIGYYEFSQRKRLQTYADMLGGSEDDNIR